MLWIMKCLICGAEDKSLVGIQEHAMNAHGYTQADHRAVTKREIEPGHYIYTFPNGTDWLDSQRRGGNVVGGV